LKDSIRLLNDPMKLDWLFLISLISLIAIGLAMVYSATSNGSDPWYLTYWFKQILHFIGGTVICAIILSTRARMWKNMAFPIYIIALIGLLAVAGGAGHISKGAGRWIAIGGFHLQPSEFAKIGYLLALSRWLSEHRVDIEKLRTFIVPGILFIVPFVLVLKQPNLSTALVFTAMTLAAFYWSGLKLVDIFLLISPIASVISSTSQMVWGLLVITVFFLAVKRKLSVRLITIILVLNIGAGYVSYMAWTALEGHQRSRILTFIDPMRDPKGEGYQVIQSKVAIGSGGLTGKGFGEGSQTNLSFLPEEHTDFIFSVLGEQFGFVGALVVLFLFFVMLSRGIAICRAHSDPFVNLVVVCSCTILFFHTLVNIAMTLGMMPVTGLPLPFMSYGGSFVLTCMALVGLLLNMRLKGHEM